MGREKHGESYFIGSNLCNSIKSESEKLPTHLYLQMGPKNEDQ